MGKSPETGVPGGQDLFIDVMEKGEFVGENISYSVPVQKTIRDSDMFVIMHAQNDNSWPLIASALVVIAKED